MTVNGNQNDINFGVKPIEMSGSSILERSLLEDLHQSRYIRFHPNDASFKVNSMDWNPSGSHLMVGSDDSVVRIFDANGDDVSVIASKKHGCDAVRFFNDTNTAIFASKYESHIGSDYHKIRHLDINRKTFLHYYCGHERQVTSISINRYHNCFLSSSLDNTIRLWDSRLQANIKPGDRSAFGVLKSLISSVADFDPMGLIFAVYLQNDCSIRFYDMRNYIKGPFKVAKLKTDPSFGDVHSIEFSPNGKRIALSTNGFNMSVLDAYSLQEISIVRGFNNELKRNLRLSWSPDSEYLFCGSSGSFAGPGNYGNLNMFFAESGTLLKHWKTMHESFTQNVKFNPKCYLIATACHDVAYWTPSSESIKQIIQN